MAVLVWFSAMMLSLIALAGIPQFPGKSELPAQFTNSLGMNMVLIPSGSFIMGSAGNEPGRDADVKDESPQHHVEITQPFYVGKHEVTRGQFRQFVDSTGYQTEAEKNGGAFGLGDDGKWIQKKEWSWKKCGFEQTDQHPVVNVTWNDAVAFVNWLTKKESRTCRLPTEAQWEYAARAGTATRYISGTLEASLDGYANLADISTKTRFPKWSSFLFNDGYIYTSPVGSFRANPMGLHDMTGNVWEWCQDAYAADYFSRSPRRDPLNDQQTGFRIARGGSWAGNPAGSHVASRLKVAPDISSHIRGFRVVALVP